MSMTRRKHGRRTQAPLYGKRAERRYTGHAQANKGAPEPSTTVMREVAVGAVSMIQAMHRGWISIKRKSLSTQPRELEELSRPPT